MGIAYRLLLAALFAVCLAQADARPLVIPRLGPCTTLVKPTPIYVSTAADLAKRQVYNNRTSILVYIKNNITLPSTYFFDSSWSCTIIKKDPALPVTTKPFLNYPGNKAPAVVIQGAQNMIFQGIGISLPWTYQWMPNCSFWVKDLVRNYDIYPDWTCPALIIYRSYNIQFTKGTISGRTEVSRSGSIEISYSRLVYDNDVNTAGGGNGTSTFTIRYQYCGDPINLVRSNNKLAHNEITGCETSVRMATVGTIVQNNYVHGFNFAGIQCGDGLNNVADCMLSQIEMNLIVKDVDMDKDGTGIYYGLHWFNPGNRETCNYIIGPPRCWYLDYTTSGVLIEGGVCINSTQGMKINTGKFNRATSLVLYNTAVSVNLLSCQNWCDNRCGGNDQGKAWWTTKLNNYSTAGWTTNWPYLANWCYDTAIDGVPCAPNPQVLFPNPLVPPSAPYCFDRLSTADGGKTYSSPPLAVQGNCSGIPLRNYVENIFVTNATNLDPTKFVANLWKPTIEQCAPFPIVPQSNVIASTSKKYFTGDLGFNNDGGLTPYRRLDLGADDPSAPIYQTYPDFMSCPRRLVGPQVSALASARADSALLSKFNRFPAQWWHDSYSIFPPSSDKPKHRTRKRPRTIRK